MKASTQAALLWPYLQPYVQQTVGKGGGGGNGSGGGGGFSHALNSALHTGILGDAQAPQFLKTDGSRTLTGHLAVADGITIDGVDLSAHVLNPDAHHARVTAGTAITLFGQQVSLALAPSPGLAVLSNALHVKNYLGIGRDGNGIWIKRATNSGLTFNASEELTLGTPATVSASSTNLVTGTTHGHATDSSSDVGTSVPNVDKLLHSTSAGGLTLRSLRVRFGDLTVTDYGDLVVGNNVLFVQNLPDEPSGANNSRVGIMGPADPQFALDVWGPIRGTELVGKHAIQLDDLALLLHYDGGHPYQTNYTGEPNAVPMGTVPSVNNNIHYRPGKFYKNAVFGRTRTNLIANGSFENDVSGWTYQGIGGSGGSFTRTTQFAHYGEASAQFAWQTGGHQVFSVPVVGAQVTPYSFGVWLKASQPITINIIIQRNGTPYTAYAVTSCNVTEEWQFFTTTGTPELNVSLRALIHIPDGVPAANTWLWVDGAQMEQASASSWYIDGSLGPGHTWNGTPFASTSTRQQTRMDYQLKDMVNHRWSIMGWIAFPFKTAPANNGSMVMYMGNGSHSLSIYPSGDGLYVQSQSNSGINYHALRVGQFTPGEYYHFAVTYVAGILRGYLNGASAFSFNLTFSGPPLSVQLGHILGGQAGEFMLDDLVISRQALNGNRVRAIYESDAPVFATSSVFSFRATPRGLVWADEEGLWMRDVDGNPVMGFYGGASATKSWGGQDLARGDILFGVFGQSNGGWLHFTRDANSKPFLKLGYAGNNVMAFDAGGASLTGVLDIDAGGGIYQGSGSFDNPLVGTGLKIWSDLIPSGGGARVGRIAGYADGTLQWGADTAGKLTAGAGSVILDANGLSLQWAATGAFEKKQSLSFMNGTTEKASIGGWQDAFGQGEYLEINGPGGAKLQVRFMNTAELGFGRQVHITGDLLVSGRTWLYNDLTILGTRRVGLGTYAGSFRSRVPDGGGGYTTVYIPYYT